MTDRSEAPFDHLRRGTAAQDWQASLDDLEWAELPSAGLLVVLAAHPDDETLGAGNVIAAAAAAQVIVLIASDGEASHPRSPSHSAADLALIRRAEAGAAVRSLAPSAQMTFLGLPDGDLAQHTAEISVALATVLTACDGEPCWLLSTWAGDRHPDHAACSAAARTAVTGRPLVTHWEYPIWLWHWGRPGGADAPLAAMRRAAGAGDRVQVAMLSYASQTAPLSDEPGDEAVLSAEFLDHFRRPFDVLIDPRWRPAAGDGIAG